MMTQEELLLRAQNCYGYAKKVEANFKLLCSLGKVSYTSDEYTEMVDEAAAWNDNGDLWKELARLRGA